MGKYFLFLDETGTKNRLHFLLLGLLIEQEAYVHAVSQYTELKCSMAQKGMIPNPNSAFHFTNLMQFKPPFRALYHLEKREAFWESLSAFIKKLPFSLLAVYVSQDAVQRLSFEEVVLRTRLTAFRSIIQMVAAVAGHIGIESCEVTHEVVENTQYEAEAESYLKETTDAPYPVVPASVIQDRFTANISWVDKNQQNMGIELADMLANPLLHGLWLARRSPDDLVPEDYYQQAVARLNLRLSTQTVVLKQSFPWWY